jgi:recombinational DNA repair protein RecT
LQVKIIHAQFQLIILSWLAVVDQAQMLSHTTAQQVVAAAVACVAQLPQQAVVGHLKVH